MGIHKKYCVDNIVGDLYWINLGNIFKIFIYSINIIIICLLRHSAIFRISKQIELLSFNILTYIPCNILIIKKVNYQKSRKNKILMEWLEIMGVPYNTGALA